MKEKLTTTHPDLLREWFDERNPEDFSQGSNYRARWKCRQGHEFFAQINDRTGPARRKQTRCPYCSGKKPIPGKTDLATRFPQLALQWHPGNAVGPHEVLPFSNKKVEWICERGHSWFAVVSNRSSRGHGCPECSGRSYPEVEIALLCSASRYGPVDSHAIVNGEEVDILLKARRVIIEYDGELWHRNRNTRDIAKTEKLLSVGYRVIRIREGALGPLNLSHPLLVQHSAEWTRDRSALDAIIDTAMSMMSPP